MRKNMIFKGSALAIAVMVLAVVSGCGNVKNLYDKKKDDAGLSVYDARSNNLNMKQMTFTSNSGGTTSSFTAQVSRDGSGRIQSMTYTGGGSTSTEIFTYDSSGRLSTDTDNSGTTTYMYDSSGNLQTKLYNGVGSTTTTMYQYNAGNQLINKTIQAGSTSSTYVYQYNSDGTLSKKIGPSGQTTTYVWNNGLLGSIIDSLNGTMTYTYDSSSRLSSETYNPKSGTYGSYTYTYTYGSNVMTMVESGNDFSGHSYTDTTTVTFDGNVPSFNQYRTIEGIVLNGGLWCTDL